MRQVSSRYPNVEAEEVTELLHSQFRPELEEFGQLVRHRPGEAMEHFTDIAHEACELVEFRKQHPEAFELRIQLRRLDRDAQRLADSYPHHSDQEQAELKRKLHQNLTEAFGIKQKLMKFELQQLRRELQELETLVKKRETNQEAIINRRLREVTGETDYLDW